MTAIPRHFKRSKTSLLVFPSRRILSYVLLTLGSGIMIYPFIWMITSAFKMEEQINAIPPVWIPNPITLANFYRLWGRLDVVRLYTNSLVITIIVTVAVMYTSGIVGYVLEKFQFWGRDFFFYSILSTMMIPWPVTLVPVYQICLKLHLVNNLGGVIVPYLFSNFGIFMIRQFMHTIPSELLDAARIDGASEWAVYHLIVFPNALPAIATLGIFTFMWQWDNFLWPLIILMDEKLYTLPIGLAFFAGRWWTDNGPMLAGATISIIPILVVFLIFQRNITEGVTLTGLKG